ncbi:hypothetical protein A3Q56_08218 [Intoshia linei]|uniref:Uncharacterized protein n=1 Tax=Intoshia linei TaxID=1819745 RepID=A0A177AQ17_9BILA|nr:hypothetical protein A3Q56_08218 [Intoshia linei]
MKFLYFFVLLLVFCCYVKAEPFYAFQTLDKKPCVLSNKDVEEPLIDQQCHTTLACFAKSGFQNDHVLKKANNMKLKNLPIWARQVIVIIYLYLYKPNSKLIENKSNPILVLQKNILIGMDNNVCMWTTYGSNIALVIYETIVFILKSNGKEKIVITLIVVLLKSASLAAEHVVYGDVKVNYIVMFLNDVSKIVIISYFVLSRFELFKTVGFIMLIRFYNIVNFIGLLFYHVGNNIVDKKLVFEHIYDDNDMSILSRINAQLYFDAVLVSVLHIFMKTNVYNIYQVGEYFFRSNDSNDQIEDEGIDKV